jgi:hypothetical protein
MNGSYSGTVTVVALLALTVGALAGHALSGPPPAPTPGPTPIAEVLRSSEEEVLRARVILNTESRFEKDMHLVAGFDNCEDKGPVHYCTALTEARTPVSYHCTVDRCEIDCVPK